MKALVVILMLILVTPAFALDAFQLMPHDKALHVITGSLIYAACHVVIQKDLLCMIPVVFAGFAKEYLWDRRPDNNDALMTIAGGGIAYSVTFSHDLLK